MDGHGDSDREVATSVVTPADSEEHALTARNLFSRLLRETVLGIACQMNDEEALAQASNLFDRWINGSER